MKFLRLLAVSTLSMILTACAGRKPLDGFSAEPLYGTNLPSSSPDCLGAKLPQGEPFPTSAIPAAAQARRQSGLVAIRYDVIGGAAQNLQVVLSRPAGLYDAAALQHAAKYRAQATATVHGCVVVIDVDFKAREVVVH